MTRRPQLPFLLGVAGLALVCAPVQAGGWADMHLLPPRVDAVTPASATTLSTGAFERRILRQVNLARAEAGMPRIRADACLDGYAESWALHLSKAEALEHRSQQVVIAGCDLKWAGEVLARGTSLTPRSTVDAWRASPSHRRVLMKRRAALTGVGVRLDDDGKIVVVLNAGDRG